MTIAPPPPLRRSRRAGRRVVEFLAVFAIASVVAAGVKAVAFRSFVVPSQSMVPTLMVEDRIGVELVSKHLRPYSRGDVVVFRDPGGWLDPAGAPTAPAPLTLAQTLGFIPESQGYLVKRIIGVAGDEVTGLADGTVEVNGEEFVVSPALVGPQDPFQVSVRAGEVFVLGDNRTRSSDSRVNGQVGVDDIVGRVAFIFSPVTRVGPLAG